MPLLPVPHGGTSMKKLKSSRGRENGHLAVSTPALTTPGNMHLSVTLIPSDLICIIISAGKDFVVGIRLTEISSKFLLLWYSRY